MAPFCNVFTDTKFLRYLNYVYKDERKKYSSENE